jgi:subtilisin family serine protease
MKKFWIIFSLFIGLAAAAALLPQNASGRKAKFLRAENAIKGRYIVVLNEKYIDKSAVAPAIESEALSLAAQYGGNVREIYSNALKGYVLEADEAAAINLSNDPRIAIVEEDSVISVTDTQANATWGLDRIDQRALPLNTQYSYQTTASNVHVYVIDSGVRPTHTDFGGRATADVNLLPDGRDGTDCLGHGTHVAGTIGSATWGVAKGVRIHGVRVLACDGTGSLSYLILGIDWVTSNHIKPAVANISITNSGVSAALDNAIQNSINAGITYVISAGNSNLDACNYSPGRVPAAITVGAIGSTDQKASYSNWGSCVDVWAPGTGITSVSYANDFDSRVMSGTSMAAPHVAGVAALYLAANPTASPSAVSQAIANSATLNAIGGLDPTSPNRLVYSWLSSNPPSGTVIIRKQAIRRTESNVNPQFPYAAQNFVQSSFVLQPNNQIADPSVAAFGNPNMITVTENPVPGWALTGITCIETAGGGQTNIVNSTVDLANRKANIIVEPGEQVDCTFTSQEISPSAANASVTGRVVTPDGRGIRGARLTLLDMETGEVSIATTNSFGFYRFDGIQVSRMYNLQLNASARLGINGDSRSFTLTEDLAGIDFIASQ